MPSLHAADGLRPDVVVILADDLGFGDLRCYNRESMVRMPKLDQMAREGVRFTDMLGPATACTPMRYRLTLTAMIGAELRHDATKDRFDLLSALNDMGKYP